MPSQPLRRLIALLAAVTLCAAPAFAFSTPLSDESIREAYFLGQRHDDTTTRALDPYSKRLAPNKTGPYISSIQFLTPFAQLVRLSSERTSGYSAQQALQEYRGQAGFVEVSVDIQFTATYGPFLSDPARTRSSSPVTYKLRSPSFWSDFQVRAFQGDTPVEPSAYNGRPNYTCSEGGCALIGATIALEFPVAGFDSDSATIEVVPPEGDSVSVDFDLTHLR
jgi:hypothetical protein